MAFVVFLQACSYSEHVIYFSSSRSKPRLVLLRYRGQYFIDCCYSSITGTFSLMSFLLVSISLTVDCVFCSINPFLINFPATSSFTGDFSFFSFPFLSLLVVLCSSKHFNIPSFLPSCFYIYLFRIGIFPSPLYFWLKVFIYIIVCFSILLFFYSLHCVLFSPLVLWIYYFLAFWLSSALLHVPLPPMCTFISYYVLMWCISYNFIAIVCISSLFCEPHKVRLIVLIRKINCKFCTISNFHSQTLLFCQK